MTTNNSIYIDNTMLQCFCKCPRSFYYRHVRHLNPQAQGISPPLNFGRAIHKGLEVLYSTNDLASALQGFKDELDPHPDSNDDKRNIATGLKMLIDYRAKWGKDEHWEILAVEVPYQFELTKDIVFCAKLDLVLKMMGQVYVGEHKTSGSTGWFTPRPNHQLSGYSFAGKVMGHDIAGAVVNILYVYAPSTKKSINERFHRIITARTEDELEEWKHWVLATKLNIDHCLSTGWFPQHTGDCFRCIYRDLCNTNKHSLEAMIASQFMVDEWKPWVVENAD